MTLPTKFTRLSLSQNPLNFIILSEMLTIISLLGGFLDDKFLRSPICLWSRIISTSRTILTYMIIF